MPRLRRTAADLAVARHMAELRVAKGVEAKELAARLGLTAQQILKYERGVDRITIGRLVEIAAVLGVPPADLFPGPGEAPAARAGGQRLTLILMRAAATLPRAKLQALCAVARALAEPPLPQEDDGDR